MPSESRFDLELWPEAHPWPRSSEAFWAPAIPPLEAALKSMQIPDSLWSHLIGTSLGLAVWLLQSPKTTPLFLGINGAQGSGKSTTAALLGITLESAFGLRVLTASIDDFYLTRAERRILAQTVHPLFITRGVPGTHDLGLLEKTLDTLTEATANTTTRVPRFNKATDDRRPLKDWQSFKGRPDVVILEGWCVGSRPQPEADLLTPINALEALEDQTGTWRSAVNVALKGPYHRLFARMDRFLMLKIPDFSVVRDWRTLQERKLAATLDESAPSAIMDSQAIARFIMHYERLTRWNLEVLPEEADLTLEIDHSHQFQKALFKPL